MAHLIRSAALVKEAASAMGIHLEPLPGYSPDFMPVEHLWQWLREDITYHTCYESQKELIDAVADFQHQINHTPLALSAPRSGSLILLANVLQVILHKVL